jgi:hypothetical protein
MRCAPRKPRRSRCAFCIGSADYQARDKRGRAGVIRTGAGCNPAVALDL